MTNKYKAQTKYDAKNTKGIYIKLNINTDEDILEWLEKQETKQGAIKNLIREKINKKQF